MNKLSTEPTTSEDAEAEMVSLNEMAEERATRVPACIGFSEEHLSIVDQLLRRVIAHLTQDGIKAQNYAIQEQDWIKRIDESLTVQVTDKISIQIQVMTKQ